MKMYSVIMAGGQGTRFWPESTSKKPKQYLSLTSDQSLLSETLDRFDGMIEAKDRFIVTVKDQELLAEADSKGKIANKGLIFEPAGRNTAPCILLALADLVARGAKDEDIVAIVPSDHVILNKKGFQDTLLKASKLASEKEKIVTIGIPPNFPHTGYGYIHRGEELDIGGHKVSSFKEKPNFEKAKEYISTGEYYWNAGMFVSSVKTLLNEFKEHACETFKHFNSLKESLADYEKLSEVYSRLPKDSIDYAIMEKSSHIAVVAAEFDWNDLGSWDALESVINKDDGNIIASCSQSHFIEAEGNIVFTPNKFVSLIGVNDLIVVSNEKATIVLPKERSQDVKKVVEYIKGNKELSDLL